MKESAIAWLALAIIISAGIFVRAVAVGEPMWLDECHTAWAVDADSIAVVASRAADGNQPPLYFGIVWSLTQLMGLSEFSIRLVSLISGSLLMVIASLWAKHLTNRWSAAILVAGLIAFDGQFIFYSSEARSYALVQLIGLVQAACFWQVISSEYQLKGQTGESTNPSSRTLAWLFGWTLLSIAILFCHYTSVWILVAELITFVLIAAKHRRFSLKCLLAGVTTVAGCLGGWSNFSTVFDRRSNWANVSSIETLWTDVEPWIVHWILIPAGFAIAGWLASFVQPLNDDTKRPPPDWLLCGWIMLWGLIGPIAIATADWLGVAPMALVRYSAVCWVAIAIFAALGLIQFTARTSWGVAAIVLASSFFGNWWVSDMITARTLLPFRSEDWVTTVQQIAAADSTEPVFQFGDVIEDVDSFSISDERFQRYLLFPILGAEAVRGGEKTLSDTQPIVPMPTWNIQFSAEHLDSIRQAKGCWLICRGDFNYALIIPDTLDRYLKEPIEFKFIPNEKMLESKVHLIRIRLVN